VDVIVFCFAERADAEKCDFLDLKDQPKWPGPKR
jgi:hypothetical protein